MKNIRPEVLKCDFLPFQSHAGYFLFQTKTFNIYRTDHEGYETLNAVIAGEMDCTALSKDVSDLLLADQTDKNLERHLKFVKASYYGEEPPVYSINLFLTDACNLRCSYCFSSFGEEEKKCSAPAMDSAVARKAVDFYLQRIAERKLPVAVNFFGGEPLLCYDRIREITDYIHMHPLAKGRKIAFYTTTNGTLLTEEMIDFLCTNGFHLVISCDGTKEMHDMFRRYGDGRGSYEVIVENIRRLASRCPDLFRLRATVTPAYPDVVQRAEHFRSLGVHRFGFEMMYDSDTSSVWDLVSLNTYAASYEAYMKDVYAKLNAGNLNPMEWDLLKGDLKRLHIREYRFHPCQMARESVTVASDGALYPCQWLVDKGEWKIGTVTEGFNSSRKRAYPDLVFENPGCSKCWARYLCGGGCPAVSIGISGSKSIPSRWMCEDRKIRWKEALSLYASLRIHRKDLINELESGNGI